MDEQGYNKSQIARTYYCASSELKTLISTFFHEVVSGAKARRAEWERLSSGLREGDVIVVWKLDQLGRSLKHLISQVQKLSEQGIGLQRINDPRE